MKEPTEDERRVQVTRHLGQMYHEEKTPEGRQMVLDATAKITGAVSKEERKAVVEKLIGSLAPKDEEKPSP